MNVARAIALFGSRAAFGMGIVSAGRKLIAALDSGDETVRMLAGMFLVKSGRRAIPLLREQLAKRRHMTTVLTVLGDIGDLSAVPDLEPYVADADAEVARAAREALEILRRNR